MKKGADTIATFSGNIFFNFFLSEKGADTSVTEEHPSKASDLIDVTEGGINKTFYFFFFKKNDISTIYILKKYIDK